MIKLLSLFSGIGAFEKALKNIGEPFEVVRYCEIDKYASKAYSLIHNLDENMNLKDVTTVKTSDLPDDIDITTYGFPCQDISNAGRQKGFTDENGDLTRSGLFFEALRIIEETKPKIAIAENVKALVGKKFTAEFKIVLDSLNDAGYKNYWAVLNSKDYGIPQNRERVFIISIRDDIDHGFHFPEKYELKLRLRDLLEETVDEKYYLSEKQFEKIVTSDFMQKLRQLQTSDICDTLLARDYKDPKVVCVDKTIIDPRVNIEVANCLTAREDRGLSHRKGEGTAVVECIKPHRLFNIYGEDKGTGYAGNVWDKNGLSPALMTGQGGNRQPMIIDDFYKTRPIRTYGDISPTIRSERSGLKVVDYFLPIKEATKKGYKEAHDGDYVNLQFPDSKTRRGRVGEQIANTLLCTDANGVVYGLRIRKLTPKECFRLMGFDDKDCDVLVANRISNTQLYKMAGNSIVVDVLEEIFVELLNQYEDVFPMEGNNHA